MSLFITKIIKKETKFLATNSKTTKSDLKETETDSEEIIKVHFRINIWMDMVGAKVKIYDKISAHADGGPRLLSAHA